MSGAAELAGTLTATEPGGHGLCVRFHWRGDRYGHTIEALQSGSAIPLLESIEGDAHSDWPPSPPFQHVNLSRMAGAPGGQYAAMLVGAGGKSHWSLCIAARDRSSQGQPPGGEAARAELVFDFACRTKVRPAWLGNAYRILKEPAAAISQHAHLVRVSAGKLGCVLLAEQSRFKFDADAGTIRCCAAATADAAFPATIRWRYTVRLAST